ncbi:MBL fold metallo-hydrolase [Novosphingobium sp. KACC 22771]|uniref:MBL fold metallo-hydrolase n=1 Tax=Novosphingobium sp. KACC 22771 TaxID=3025670 RepID=UPI0023663B09|nr:MBL fold metallo-hydrolase [Novosphingobium sp. KACC 22771]WDF71374.1 MBL fold metallo-hydrolase [Novosphingobium sp. KACC 22771]
MTPRRASLAALFLCLAGTMAHAQSSPVPANTGPRLILLGTGGGPGGRVDRAGIATMLEVNGRRYLIDAGGGVSRQLAMAGIAERDVPLVFLTHLHDDHYAGLLSLASFSYSTRGKAMALIGPAGTTRLTTALGDMLAVNARIRGAESGAMRPVNAFLSARDIGAAAGKGPVFKDETIAVTAVTNTHYALVDKAAAPDAQSLSYRFTIGAKSVVFTGDTGTSPDLATFAKGADVLVAEMATAADRAAVPPQVRQHMDVEHLSPAQVGDLARQAGVGKLVLSHVGTVSEQDLAEVRAHYSGPVVLGRDLQTISF